jgi:hypothetical protein
MPSLSFDMVTLFRSNSALVSSDLEPITATLLHVLSIKRGLPQKLRKCCHYPTDVHSRKSPDFQGILRIFSRGDGSRPAVECNFSSSCGSVVSAYAAASSGIGFTSSIVSVVVFMVLSSNMEASEK